MATTRHSFPTLLLPSPESVPPRHLYSLYPLSHLDDDAATDLVWCLGLVLQNLGDGEEPSVDVDGIGLEGVRARVFGRHECLVNRVSRRGIRYLINNREVE